MKQQKKPSRKNPSYKLISEISPNCYATEAYRRVKVCLDTLSVDQKNQVIQICSATPGDGKTTTLLNVAVIFAQSGKKVLLVDLDLHKPKMHRAFKMENVDGISDYLSEDVENMKDIIKPTRFDGLDFIGAGSSKISSYSLLNSKKLEDTIKTLRKSYDVILIDEPPVLATTDCCIIARFCDAAIFQISRKNTDKKAVRNAVKILQQNDVNVIGCVFTEVENDADSYSYDYKY